MSRLSFLRRHFRDLPRFSQIMALASKHGFGHFLEQAGLQKFISFGKRVLFFRKELPEEHRLSAPQRLRMLFEELGPSFIKFGQLLACRPDMLPIDYAQELCKLTDSVPPFPFEQAKEIIEKDLKAPLTALFIEFDPVPLGAASIAQVHRAMLPGGQSVIVKVQRPHIQGIILKDISILRGIAEMMEQYIPEMRVYNPRGIVEEFSRTIRKELDFIIEASNAVRLRKNFEGNSVLYVPQVYLNYSSSRVLVLEHLEGIRIDDFETMDRMGLDRTEISRKGAEAYFQMVFRDGFFHADPHPGNLFVLNDGRLGLVDFGIMGRVTDENMQHFANIFVALVKRDFDALAREYINLGFVSRDVVDIDRFRRDLKGELADLFEPYYGLTVKQINFSSYVERVTTILIRYHMQQPENLYLVNKTLLTLEGLLKRLDPEFDYIAVARPYVARLIRSRRNPRTLVREAWENISDFEHVVTAMPRQVSALFRKVLQNDIHVSISHKEIDRLIRDVDKSSNRLSFSIITAAIIVASSIVVHSGMGSTFMGFPLFGIIGYFIAGILGLWLLIGIIRSGHL